MYMYFEIVESHLPPHGGGGGGGLLLKERIWSHGEQIFPLRVTPDLK